MSKKSIRKKLIDLIKEGNFKPKSFINEQQNSNPQFVNPFNNRVPYNFDNLPNL